MPTILVVDDNDDLRDLATVIIEEMGYTALGAPNGDEALRVIESSSGKTIDLLFTDIVMPGRLNGFALAREAKARRPEIKVIYTTGYSNMLQQGIEGETFGPILKKPFRPRVLAEEIRRALGGVAG